MKRSLTLGLLVAVACVTAACNPFRRSTAVAECNEPINYASAVMAPVLKIPPGLQSPDTRNALQIPDLTTPEPPPRTRDQGCLDTPPPYTVTRPLEPEA